LKVCVTSGNDLNPNEHNTRTYPVHLFTLLQHVSVVLFHHHEVEITSILEPLLSSSLKYFWVLVGNFDEYFMCLLFLYWEKQLIFVFYQTDCGRDSITLRTLLFMYLSLLLDNGRMELSKYVVGK